MPATSCPDSQRLSAYVAGELSRDDSVSIAAHLQTCSKCRSIAAALQRAPARVPVGGTYVPGAELSGSGESAERAAPEPVPDPVRDTHVPAELGEYRVLEKLGEGGMGAVYKALHTRLDKIVALKMLPKASKANEWLLGRFDREMKAIGRLNHPNVIQAYDARDIAGIRFLVMEYVDGVDLSALVEHFGPLGIADACELARQAALGLEAAHEHGLVHRDVKPSNLMLTSQGQVKLLDLGLARFQAGLAPGGELTGAGQIMGTADYIAPEQVSDSRNVDIRADIYSLGCTLYKLLAGDTVFSGSQYTGLYEILMAHVLKSPVPIRQVRSEIPEALAAVIHRMLAKQPADRFSTPAEAAGAIAPFAAGHNLIELWRRSEAKAKSSAATDRPVLATAESYSASPGTTTRAPRPAELAAAEATQPPESAPLRVLASARRWRVVARIGIVGVLCLVAGVLAAPWMIPFGEDRPEPIVAKPQAVAPTEPAPSTPQAAAKPQAVAPAEPVAAKPEAKAKPQTKAPPKPRPAPSTPKPPRAISPFDSVAASRHQEAWAKHLGIPVAPSNSIGMKLVLIPAGEFEMGSAWTGEGPPHRVKITRPFCLGVYEVTQAEYQGVMGASPSHFALRGDGRQKVDRQETARHPVESVSWQDAIEFCRKLSELPAEKSARRSYRLPTEAEWEYACRAGTTTPWLGGDHEAALGDYAWLRPLADEATHPVGRKKPNAWGLHDVHGNVFEWCADWFSSDSYKQSAAEDPTGPPSGLERVIRGGSWWNLPKDCRSAARVGSPADGSNMIGFRVASDLGEQ